MNRETIYLAALLHDIGKFWQRADESGTASSKILSASTKRNEGLYCPQYNGRYSHKHVLWTAEFLDRHRQFFESALGGSEHFEAFFKASVKHHAPDRDDVYQLIVQKADHYASGADRTGESGQKDAEAENAWDSFKNVRMVSIFEGLLRDSNFKNERRVPIKALSLSDDHFPTLEKEAGKGWEQYDKLWSEFEQAFLQLKEADCDTLSLAENLSFLLHRYAGSVPSSTMHLPDVSLYDHLKSTAIFAICLHDYLAEKGRLNANFNIANEEAPVLIVGGDLSGIQSYIYDIVSTDAARNLKGRSFYLQILVENAVELILARTGLPWSAVVYASGGGFYLLAPNTDAVRESLTAARKQIADCLFDAHQTNLTLHIDWQEVTHKQIMQQCKDDGIHEAWAMLSKKIARLKNQKLKDRIKADYAYFFTPSEIGGKQRRDHITGEEFTKEENKAFEKGDFGKLVFELDNEERQPIKSGTEKQIRLGKNLRVTDFWVTSKVQIPQWREYEYQIGNLPVYNYLFSLERLKQVGQAHPDDVTIRALHLEQSGYNARVPYFRGKRCIYGFTFYGGNDYPEHESGQPVTFDDMAKMGPGAQKLGVLRMDVDNLGAIFISGLENNRRTFSRYSVISRNLDYFFKGYLNHIWETNYRENTSIIYSGGDDLFIVGHWSAIFAFAQRIQEQFAKWVCYNPNLTISGGVALTGGKFPISKGAGFAADAEGRAKAHRRPTDTEKNAIAIFGVPLGWDREYPMVLRLKNEMFNLIKEEKMPRGELQKMLNYAEMARTQSAAGGSTAWKWHMAYNFSRAAKFHNNSDTAALYDMIKTAAYTGQWMNEYVDNYSLHTFIDLLEVAARWTEIETKY